MIAEPIGQALKLLSNCVHDSTAGVAVFDEALRCCAYDETFFVMLGGSTDDPHGKTIQQLFGDQANLIEPGLLRAWSTGNSASNCPPSAAAADLASLPRWVVNFHPVKDAQGKVWFIATTFSEVSLRNNAEIQLSRLKNTLNTTAPNTPDASHSEVSAWNSRVLELIDPPSSAPSRRERQVLHHLADGKSNKQIGVVLHLSTRTVETYRARLMLKLRLHSTAELVRYAIRHQISVA